MLSSQFSEEALDNVVPGLSLVEAKCGFGGGGDDGGGVGGTYERGW